MIAQTTGRTLAYITIMVIAGIATSVGAQIHRSVPGLGDAYRPDYVRRDAQIFAEALQLDPDQRTIVETLFDDYEHDFQTGIDGVREKLAEYKPSPAQLAAVREEFQDRLRAELAQLMADREEILQNSGGQDVSAALAELGKRVEAIQNELTQFAEHEAGRHETVEAHMVELERAIAEWKVQKTAIREDFEASLKSVLSEQQLERWPIVERQMRRMKTLNDGVLAGESVDMIALVKRAPLRSEATAAVLRSLETYEVDLDNALRARNEWLDQYKAELQNALGARDVQRVQTLAREEFQLRRAVRDVNLAAAGQVTAAVGPEDAAELTRLFNDAAFPQVYRSTTAERTFQSVLRLDDLDEDQQLAVQDLHAAYRSELAAVNERIVRTIVQEQAEQQIDRLQRQVTRGYQPREDPIRAMFLERVGLDERYLAQLGEVLSDAQRDAIPALASGSRGATSESGVGAAEGAEPIPANNDFLTQFDADQDGQLDASEQEAMRAHLHRIRGTVGSPQ